MSNKEDDNTCSDLQDKVPSHVCVVNYHGFTSRPTFYQIVLPLYLILSILSLFFFLYTMMLQTHFVIVIIATILIAILLIAIAYYWYHTTSIDPTDHVQVLHK